MQTAPPPSNENERLAALRQTGALDTEPEGSFDRLTDMAAKVCGVPIALITLVDVDRQWFKSCVGLDVEETPRDVAFCAHAILQKDIMVVRDALDDARFADNPLVTSDPKIRFYAGCPIRTRDDLALGTLCVIDTKPRDLTLAQIAVVKQLAHHAATLLDLRRTKDLLGGKASEWERANAEGRPGELAEKMAGLGEHLDTLLRDREQAEAVFRELEGEVVAPASQPRAELRDPDPLLREIIDRADRMRAHGEVAKDAARIQDAAQQVREMLGGAGA